MSAFLRVVYTIHGINSDGKWQQEVEQELAPHFHCIQLKYRQFRRLGWPKILIPLLRRLAIKAVARQLSQSTAPAERAHLIAHSFGTWISEQLMRRPGTYFNRVIFVASPLPSNLDWEDALKDNPDAFRDLTNEYGLADQVLGLGDLTSGRECAGRVGFQGSPDRIHDTRSFRLSCPRCRGLPESSQARIHNIERSSFHHSDWFVGSRHCGSLWLPYLWGFPPEEYADFIEACLELADLESKGAILALKEKEKAFNERSWAWTERGDSRLSMAEYIEESIHSNRVSVNLPADGAAVRRHRALATRQVWQLIKDAVEERRRPVKERRRDFLRRLHPNCAIHAAIMGVERPWTTGD